MFDRGFPVIDMAATGENIKRLRIERGLTVRDLQQYFGFEEPQAIYKWQRGQSLPTVDNLYALGMLLGLSMDEILVPRNVHRRISDKQQEESCCSVFLLNYRFSAIRPLLRYPSETNDQEGAEMNYGGKYPGIDKLQLGDTLVLPLCFQPGLRKEGTVVYIHPEKRFFTAEFDCGQNIIRESYCAHGKLE